MTISEALPLLACPDSKEPLRLVTQGAEQVLLTPNGSQYRFYNDVPVFVDILGELSSPQTPSNLQSQPQSQLPVHNQTAQNLAASFEELYSGTSEPWSYTGRAAEFMRHDFVAAIAHRYMPHPRTLLDLGCSIGQLSEKLGEQFATTTAHGRTKIVALDVSPTAVLKARNRCLTRTKDSAADFFFVTAGAADLPFASGVFDVVIASDGLHGWELPLELQQRVVRECERVLAPEGYVVFTDYLHPKKFDHLIEIIRNSPLQIVAVEYLYDRLWYQMESWFHLVQNNSAVKAILRNRSLAHVLKRVSRLFGRDGSKHICIVAQKRSV